MSRYVAVVLALLCCAGGFAGGIAATQGSYDLSVAGSVDVPDREVTLQGEEYTVSAIGVVSPGDAIDVSVDAPGEAEYDLHLYNDDRQPEDGIYDAGGSETFDGNYPAGSYIVAVNVDGQVRTVHPVVVSSYDVTLDAPETAEPGDTVEFTVDVENVPGTEENLDAVQVVVSEDGDDETVTATETGDGSYTAEAELPETGEYLVYANVRAPDSTNGQQELIGASQSSTVTVRDPTPTATETATDTDGGDSSNGETDTPTDADTATDTDTATSAANSTATATDTPTDGGNATATATMTATESAGGSTATPAETTSESTTTSDGVLTPNDDRSTTTTGGLSALAPILALLGFGLLRRRRN